MKINVLAEDGKTVLTIDTADVKAVDGGTIIFDGKGGGKVVGTSVTLFNGTHYALDPLSFGHIFATMRGEGRF